MTTLTLEIPEKSASKYKEIFNYFIVNYDITELEQIKEKTDISKKLYIDYNSDIEWQKDIWNINTSWKNKKEILSELNNTLWN